jgi:hypothetical protein
LGQGNFKLKRMSLFLLYLAVSFFLGMCMGIAEKDYPNNVILVRITAVILWIIISAVYTYVKLELL